MVIAHLPAGYLVARGRGAQRAVLAVGCVDSVLPDLDLAWFYLIDNRQHAHHDYFHAPLFWLVICGLWLGLGRALGYGRAVCLRASPL